MTENFLRRNYLVCFILLMTVSVFSQDIHFSQFYQSPLNLNPALTGVMRANQRFVANYRNQWASALGANAYNTYSASYDQKIEVGTYDYFGIGGSLWGDVAGATRFGSTSGRISASFSYYLNGGFKSAHYLTVGTDVGIVQRRVRTGDLRWPSQHTNGVFDPNAGASEIINENNFIYPDLSVGLMWFSIFDERNSFYAGVAAAHVNEPNISFFNDTPNPTNSSRNLYRRYTFHAGGEYGLTETIGLLPGIVVMLQGPHREYNAGTSFRFELGNDNGEAFQVGVWTRLGTQVGGGLHSDAVIFSTKFDTSRYGLGFSYDFTTSDFRQAGTANGSFEFSVTYLINRDDRRKFWYPKVHS